MKQFLNILKFEFLGYLKNKIFIGITFSVILLIGLVLSYPRIFSMLNTGDVSTDTTKKEVILISDMTSTDKNFTLSFFTNGLPNNQIKQTSKSVEELKEAVNKGECDSALVITTPTNYTYIVKNVGMYDTSKNIIDEIMVSKYRVEKLAEMGIALENSQEILSPSIVGETIQMGKNQMNKIPGTKSPGFSKILP